MGKWAVLIMAGAPVFGQWAQYHDPTIPRTRDGKPNLSAPAPKTGGKPDLTGIWIAESGALKDIQRFLLPGGINGLGEDLPSKYFFNFFADVPPGQEPFQPAAAALYKKMSENAGKPSTLCELPSLPLENVIPAPFKIVQTARETMFLYEADSVFRQVFADGRKLPADPQPSWMGYSVGRWEGDTFVIETVGLNDRSPLDEFGHPHSESMKLTERYRRRDFGHLDSQVTMDDPKTYTKPVTVSINFRLVPDTELLESFCHEDEKDLTHFASN